MYSWSGFWRSYVPPSPKSHEYVSVWPSGSDPLAENDTGSGASPVFGSAVASTVGDRLQISDPAAPAASSIPPRMCLRNGASEYESSVWPMPVYHERPPSYLWHQEIGWSSSTPSLPSASSYVDSSSDASTWTSGRGLKSTSPVCSK